jgi:phage terminase large subunit-like protein
MRTAPDCPADEFRLLPLAEQMRRLAGLTLAQLRFLRRDWYGWWARAAQRIPAGPWSAWVVLAGRGFGKTRTGAEWCKHKAHSMPGSRGILIGRTRPDARDVMVEGESGILSLYSEDDPMRPLWEPSRRTLTWPNGTTAKTYSADEPDQLRGPQCHWGWGDEIGAWKQPALVGELNALDNFLLGLRLKWPSVEPQAIFTTTPRRGPLLKKILNRLGTVTTGGSTYENYHNLAASFITDVVNMYEGTRIGQQELYAILAADNPDALWHYAMIEAGRRIVPARLKRITVGVDPEAVSTEQSAETGILVAGRGFDNQLYVLDDFTVRGKPGVWGQSAVDAYRYYKANRMVGEINQGGDMVEHVIMGIDKSVAFKAVRATRGKLTRAEPISLLYEKGRAQHCKVMPELESQLCDWVPGERSPDRLDALVWAATDLMFGGAYRGSGVAGPPRDLLAGSRV